MAGYKSLTLRSFVAFLQGVIHELELFDRYHQLALQLHHDQSYNLAIDVHNSVNSYQENGI